MSKYKTIVIKANSDTADKDNIISNEYNYEKDLNWRDDGNEFSDPSSNDFLKGYQMDPYAFKQWASKHKSFNKLAMNEAVLLNVLFSPEYLANEMLTLWNGADGPLQNFFDAFTLRYNNQIKKSIAKILTDKGYKIYPVLTDDQPKYAKHENVFRKVVASKHPRTMIEYIKAAFPKSIALKKLAEEVDQLEKADVNVTKDDTGALLDYYKLIYPKDYALSLVTIMFDDKPEDAGKQFDTFKDFDMSDETLDQIEQYMGGHADSYKKDGGVGGYDFISDSRSFDGTPINQYEVQSSKKKLY